MSTSVTAAGPSKLPAERARAVMALADAMSAGPPKVDEGVFQQARACFDEDEILELSMTIAYYNMLGRMMVALQIEVEPGFDPNR